MSYNRLIPKMFFCCLAFFIMPEAYTQKIKTDRKIAREIDTYMQAAVKYTNFSGSILIARNGKPIIKKGYGMANYEWNVPNTPNTIFRLGSTTKAITATAIMMLQQNGKLNVDDPICKYLDNCPSAWELIKLRHLLNHTSGIPDFALKMERNQKLAVPLSKKEILELVASEPLEFAPGTKSKYVNTGFYILGLIIEKVTGKTYDVFLNENIFVPLGMNFTSYDSARPIVKNRASGYVIRDGKLVNAGYVAMDNPFAAGAIMSTTEDLLLFDQALYDERLLSKQSKAQMFTSKGGGYAFGWDILKEFGRDKIEKGGNVPDGFSANLSRFTNEKITIIFLGNNFSTHVRRAAIDAAAIVFGAPYEMPKEIKAITVKEEILRQYVGTYHPEEGSQIIVSFENGKLMRQVSNQPKAELRAKAEDKFFINGNTRTFSFIKDHTGRVTELWIEFSGAIFKSKKIK